jgi:hypothetical protein
MGTDDGNTLGRNVCYAAYTQGSFGEEFTEQKVKLADFPRCALVSEGNAHDPLLDLRRVGKCDERPQAHPRLFRRAGQAHEGGINSIQ